jgi:PRTRC genetic system ThiF family protein
MFLKIPNYFQNPRHSISILLVGAGGTGSEILTKLGRLAYTLNEVHQKDLMVCLCDPDKVDTPNLGRQLFTPGDIGEYKSDILIQRMNRFFGTNWRSFPFSVSEVDFRGFNIIISCTDNVESRKEIRKKLNYERIASENRTYFWLDTGNDFNSGNIILSSKIREIKSYLPNAFEIFGDIKNNIAVPSCSLAEAIKKQHILVNSFVADLASSMLWDILTQKKIDYQGFFFSLETMKIVKVPVGYYKKKKHEALSV